MLTRVSQAQGTSAASELKVSKRYCQPCCHLHTTISGASKCPYQGLCQDILHHHGARAQPNRRPLFPRATDTQAPVPVGTPTPTGTGHRLPTAPSPKPGRATQEVATGGDEEQIVLPRNVSQDMPWDELLFILLSVWNRKPLAKHRPLCERGVSDRHSQPALYHGRRVTVQ